jgi:hypothetical protein
MATTMIYEPDLPKALFMINGERKKLPDYRELYSAHAPDTLVKVANNIGSFTFELGSGFHETILNRKKAQVKYCFNNMYCC